jgi:hypothetical protein
MKNQRLAMRKLFEEHPNEWIPLPFIKQCASQYNTRIFELRGEGMNIGKPKEERVNGERWTWYKYIPPVVVQEVVKAPEQTVLGFVQSVKQFTNVTI